MGFTESLFSVTLSHSSLILSNFTQDFTVSPRRFGKEGHHLFSYSSASLHTQHRLLPQPSETPLGHTGVICPSTILYQDVSCSIVLASNPSTIVVQPVSISVSHSLCDLDKSNNFAVQNEMPSTPATTHFIPQPVLLSEFKSQLVSPTIIHIKRNLVIHSWLLPPLPHPNPLTHCPKDFYVKHYLNYVKHPPL